MITLFHEDWPSMQVVLIDSSGQWEISRSPDATSSLDTALAHLGPGTKGDHKVDSGVFYGKGDSYRNHKSSFFMCRYNIFDSICYLRLNHT